MKNFDGHDDAEAVGQPLASLEASLLKKEFEICQRLRTDDLRLWTATAETVPDRKSENSDSTTSAERKSDTDDFSESEIRKFVRIIEEKFQEESRVETKVKFCTNDRLPRKNSYYCLASLRPGADDSNSTEIGPLIFGPFFLTSSNLSICGDSDAEELRRILPSTDSFIYPECEDQCGGTCERRSKTGNLTTKNKHNEGLRISPECLCNSTGWIYKACDWISVKEIAEKTHPLITDTDTDHSENVDDKIDDFEMEACNDCTAKKHEEAGIKEEENKKSIGCRRGSKCELRVPIILSHHESYNGFSLGLKEMEDRLCASCYLKSDEVAKWGNCFQVVASVLREKDTKMCRNEESIKSIEEMQIDVDEADERSEKSWSHRAQSQVELQSVCRRHDDNFEDLHRFQSIGTCGFAKLCRNLLKWAHCTSKNWRVIKGLPHLVVHLPSLGYSNDLRCRASKTFDYLQNIQVGRLGWLDDPNVQLLYVFPSHQNEEFVEILQSLVLTVRPDVDVKKRLWMVQPNVKCNVRKCLSGSENLFFSPETYRRVRHLTAGCRAFILPGIMNEMDVFIACELKIPIIGPPLKFQKRLLSKSHCMELLHQYRINHPPFLHVHNFQQLCKGLAAMTFRYPLYKKWLVKIDEGFSGYQTAAVSVDEGPIGNAIRSKKRICNPNENDLSKLFAELLPNELKLNREIYGKCEEFFDDLKRHGAVIEARPTNKYDVVSVGIFVEHDSAKAMIVNAADVIRLETDTETDVAIDIGYIFPQKTIPRERLLEVTKKVGHALRDEHLIGYFGFDVVAFPTTPDISEFWVVDVDPYYTDLIACTDWIKFCLGPGETSVERETQHFRRVNKTNLDEECDIEVLLKQVDRHVVYSGKLYNNELSKYYGDAFLSLSTNNNIFYDKKKKVGCIVIPTDYEKRAVTVISMNSNRVAAIDRFISTLKTLHKISFDGDFTKRIISNMLDVAKELEHGRYEKM